MKRTVAEELNRADDALKAADLLFTNDLLSDAVSKLYYFLLYHIRALLLTKDYEPRSHEGALRLFGLHFVKENTFSTDAFHTFSKMMKYREEADYNPMYQFTKKDFVEFRAEVVSVSEQVKKYLSEGGSD
jgi:uncharacterized protein (UPF0332 family)